MNIKISYNNKSEAKDILEAPSKTNFLHKCGIGDNMLFCGDNKDALLHLVRDRRMLKKVDLIYIDPPFATNNKFTVSGKRSNSISQSSDGIIAYNDNLLGADFLEFIRTRLIILKELLSDQGSIYLHIDYKIGHYIKIIMDEVFGISNFRNDITRIKCNPKNFNRSAYGNIKDMILFYSKSKSPIWNEIKEPYKDGEKNNLFKKKDENGRFYTTIPLHAPGEVKGSNTGGAWNGINPPPGRHWRVSTEVLDEWSKDNLIEWSKNGNPRKKIFADERDGKKRQDIWEFKDTQNPEYPTQKNTEMLSNIILNSSNEGSLVLDCFCGSGSFLVESEKLNRKWVGVDISNHAINVTKSKVKSDYEFYESS